MSTGFLLQLLAILTAAWLLGYGAQRMGLPVMLGELAAGILLGPVLGLIHPSEALALLAELGIFFAMFYAGLEMDPRELVEHFWPALAVALGGFLLPFFLGVLVTHLFGGTLYQSLFVGLGCSITAIAIQAVVLQSLRIHRTEVGHILMAAALVDDILALIALSILLGLVREGHFQPFTLGLILLKVGLFFGFTILVGELVLPRFAHRITDEGGKAVTFALVMALAMAWLAEEAGLHHVIGAFLAGQFVRREVFTEEVYEALSDRFYGLSYGFLLPVFFVTLAFHLHFSLEPSFLLFCGALTLAAVVGKLFGAGAGLKPFGFSWGEALVVGAGMNGRGAVELVVAAVVMNLSRDLLSQGRLMAPLLTQEQFSALVVMAFVTTLLAPVLLRYFAFRACTGEAYTSLCEALARAQKKPIPG
ncbi:cation:proton antiporter [Thermosulfurimonas marina]|uniref:Cation:proton antiporter n=1 Tax=Thermosulfurimonas marina TaxID=2047767 RepID=A0A6H1WTQ3_9BACT|nr:cation:proton antiporter [Thermosulfurimonas marina]QJA06587.1 cation:proton antiporter [Thermosulfurimonas marina]